MIDKTSELIAAADKGCVLDVGGLPGPLADRLRRMISMPADCYWVECERLAGLNEATLMREVGQYRELPFHVLKALLGAGSDDPVVAGVLRNKRREWLTRHPELLRSCVSPDCVIAYDGRAIPIENWRKMDAGERRGVLVGSTCAHYNSDVPGLSDDQHWMAE